MLLLAGQLSRVGAVDSRASLQLAALLTIHGHVGTSTHVDVTDLDGFFFCLGVEQAGGLALLVLHLLLDGLNLTSTLHLHRLHSHTPLQSPCHDCGSGAQPLAPSCLSVCASCLKFWAQPHAYGESSAQC